MDERTIGIAMLGCGVVGSGVATLLLDHGHLLHSRTGLNFELRHVVVRNRDKAERRPELPLTTDPAAAIADPRVQIVVELIGGTGVAGESVRAALRAGKAVVTANKSLLAAHGPELFKLAREHNTSIGFEASCGGGIPIINALSHGLLANRIDALVGIVNGTCNFILTQMTRRGWTYPQALAEAQKLGFAEADPAMDVSGRDAAQKLAVLAGLAFNATVKESDVYVEGIDTLQDADIKLARELGYVIKLLAIGQRVPDGEGAGEADNRSGGGGGAREADRAATHDVGNLTLRVHPTLVREHDVLADVSGSFNAVSIYGHALGHALFYGRGAGQMPTASAVVADIVNVALGVTPLAFKQLRIFPDSTPPARVLPIAQLTSRYYLRLLARDEPGVMAQVTQILGSQRISLSAVLQHEEKRGQFVPIVITTHLAREGSVQQALREINALPAISGPAVCLRIIDQPREFAAS